jgi:hypothetical protein
VDVFNYLADTVQRRSGRHDCVIAPVIRNTLALAAARDVNSLATTAYHQGRWPLAADAWRLGYRLLASDPGAGEEHPDTLASRGNLAVVLRDLGRPDEAAAGQDAVAAPRQRVPGRGDAGAVAAGSPGAAGEADAEMVHA